MPPDTRTELEKTVDKSFPQSPGLWKPDRELKDTTSKFDDKTAREGAREIWNTNWRKELQGWEGAKEREAAFAARREAPAELGTGYLSFSRVAELDNMDLDLTSGLSSRGEGVAEEAKGVGGGGARGAGAKRQVWASTRGEGQKWKRSGRFTTAGVRATAEAIEKGEKGQTEEEVAAAIERDRAASAQAYERTKTQLLLSTVATAALGGWTCYQAYGKDAAVSWGIGAVGAVLYVRLLSRSADAVASEDEGAQLGGAASQPRILIPVFLVLFASKGHDKFLGTTGVDVNILALMAGFFSYKVSSFLQVVGAVVAGED